MRNMIRPAFFKYSRFLVLVVLCVIFAMTTTTFWRPGHWDNIANILLKQAPFSILMAISMTLSIIVGGLDLSIGASVALISCTAGKVLHETGNPLLGICVALTIGLLVGLCNGLLIAKVKLPIFIATYSMKWILQGMALIVTGGQQVYSFGTAYTSLFTSSPVTLLAICIVLSAAVSILLNKSCFGKALYATGTNQVAANFSGVQVEKIKIITYIISGLIMAVVSLMYIANLNATDPVTGGSYAINAVAATLVGGTAMGGGHGKVYNAVVGSMIFLVLTNGLILLGIPSLWLEFVIGVIILLSVAFDAFCARFHKSE